MNNNVSNKKYNNVLKIVVGICIAIVVVFIVIKLVHTIKDDRSDAPFIIDGTRIANRPKKFPGYKVQASYDQKYGIEFSYSLWLWIEGNTFEGNDGWKHVFHKGNDSAYPLQAPGVWIYPGENKLAIIMNSFNDIKNTCNVGNLPINKWFLLNIVVIGNNIDVYINGQLKKRCEIQGIPKQNYGDIYVTKWGGFTGFISNFQYFSYALPYYQLEQIFKQGPSQKACVEDSSDNSQYLAQNWWMTTGFPNAEQM